MGQESRSSLAGWFWFGVFHKTAIKVAARSAVTWGFTGAGGSTSILLCRSWLEALIPHQVDFSIDWLNVLMTWQLASPEDRMRGSVEGKEGQREVGRKEREGAGEGGRRGRENMQQSTKDWRLSNLLLEMTNYLSLLLVSNGHTDQPWYNDGGGLHKGVKTRRWAYVDCLGRWLVRPVL